MLSLNNRSQNKISILVPGKLMLAGEWSVLEDGNSCIVLPINKFVCVSIWPSKSLSVTAPEIGIQNFKLDLNQTETEPETLAITKKTIKTVLEYLQENNVALESFALHIDSSDMFITTHDGIKKIGLGSSAAVTVALVKAMLIFHGQDVTSSAALGKIFKLACIAHYKAQESTGSGFDIAASTYQKPLHYKRFNIQWFTNELNRHAYITKLINYTWPCLHIEPIALPKNFLLCSCYTGYSASTKTRIKQVFDFKEKSPNTYNIIIDAINQTVLDLLDALKNNHQTNIHDCIRKNRELLKQLGQASASQLETPELTQLISQAESCGAAAKFSGAGGG
ncbi:MAG: phosphomevalonate kinase, partial [bacterium]